jgi:small-conductance mechanosensitive channel
VIDTCVGKVERIGIKTTRLRSETGEQIILSNADILKSRVRNYGPTDERRALLTLNVDRDTHIDTLREIPRLVAQVVQSMPRSRFERCHLKTLSDWSLQFEVSFFTRDPVGNPILDLQQAVNLGILEVFRDRGIKIAMQSQRLVFAPDSASPAEAGGNS